MSAFKDLFLCCTSIFRKNTCVKRISTPGILMLFHFEGCSKKEFKEMLKIDNHWVHNIKTSSIKRYLHRENAPAVIIFVDISYIVHHWYDHGQMHRLYQPQRYVSGWEKNQGYFREYYYYDKKIEEDELDEMNRFIEENGEVAFKIAYGGST